MEETLPLPAMEVTLPLPAMEVTLPLPAMETTLRLAGSGNFSPITHNEALPADRPSWRDAPADNKQAKQ
jgi:hypothetical protein